MHEIDDKIVSKILADTFSATQENLEICYSKNLIEWNAHVSSVRQETALISIAIAENIAPIRISKG